jgi:hypothetical protein
MSEGPPAANGTYRVIGRLGQACACAPVDAMIAAAPAALKIVLRFIIPPSLHGWERATPWRIFVDDKTHERHRVARSQQRQRGELEARGPKDDDAPLEFATGPRADPRG